MSPLFIGLTVALFISSAITTFDKRLNQAKAQSELPAEQPTLPGWVSLLYWVNGALIVALLVLNWKYALIVVAVRFVFAVLPVLEIVGNVLMAPFKPKVPPPAT